MLTDPATLLSKTERRYTDAYIPGLDDTVRFRSMSAGELLACLDAKTPLEARVGPVVATVCNANGRLIYTRDDIPTLGQVDGQIIDAMLEVINEHCANRTPVEKLVALAKKNSEEEATANPSE